MRGNESFTAISRNNKWEVVTIFMMFVAMFRAGEWTIITPFSCDKSLIHITHSSGLWFYNNTSAVKVRDASGKVVFSGGLSFIILSIPASILQYRLLK